MMHMADNSKFQWLLAAVSYVMAEPNVRAIAQSLTLPSLLQHVRVAYKSLRRLGSAARNAFSLKREVSGTAALTPAVMRAAIGALSDRAGELTIKAQKSEYEKIEVTIKLMPETSQKSAELCNVLPGYSGPSVTVAAQDDRTAHL